MAKGAKTGGRVAGTPNKTTASMKEAMQHVYATLQDRSGAAHGHFVEWAEEYPTEFYKLTAKLLPLQISGEEGGPLKVEIVRLAE